MTRKGLSAHMHMACMRAGVRSQHARMHIFSDVYALCNDVGCVACSSSLMFMSSVTMSDVPKISLDLKRGLLLRAPSARIKHPPRSTAAHKEATEIHKYCQKQAEVQHRFS